MPAPAQPNADRASIRALLERRAEAVMARDKKGFMATVADESPAFVQRQRRLFNSMKRIPFASYGLRADWSAWGDLVRPGDRARYAGAEAVSIPATVERYRIRGLDTDAAVEDLFYSYVKREGGWLIAEDQDVQDIGFQTARHPWDFGRVRVQRLGRFHLFRHPCDGGVCARLPESMELLLEGALTRARRHWPGPWPKRIGVVVPETGTELRRILQASFDVTEFIAFAYSTVNDGAYTAPRMVLNWRTLDDRSPDSVARVFAHELVHVGTRSSSGPFVPIFVDEGFADHVANEGSPSSLAFFDAMRGIGAVDGVLPQDFEFTTGSGQEIFLNYQTAQSAVGFFVRTWGARAFERFYKRLGGLRSVAGTAEYQVSRVMRRAIGIGFRRFERAWADSLGL